MAQERIYLYDTGFIENQALMSEPLIELSNVSWQRDGTSILKNVSLSIHKGEILTLIGPNGAGKTSLVNIVIGLNSPLEGEIKRSKDLQIGYMPQQLNFDRSLPISVEHFLRLTTPKGARVKPLCERLDIENILQSKLHSLSGGEMQRVLLARAVLHKPDLLVLDEPTQGVDVIGQEELYRHVSEIRSELECSVLMVSHDLHLVMAQTDRVICLNRHICCHGEPEDVSKHPEYLELFGQKPVENIAVYTHHHDHEHDIHGSIVKPHSSAQEPDTDA